MNASNKALIQILVALLIAVAAGLLVYRWLDNKERAQASKGRIATVNVVVSAVELPQGTLLTSENLRQASYMPDSVPAGSFTDPAQLENRTLAQAVGSGEPITAMRLVDESVRAGGVGALIPPGKRAMSVRGNEVMGLSGFIRPGDRVDVLVTLYTGEQDDEPVTKTVLEHILILATGTELEPDPDGGKPAPVDIYTLELTPEESEIMALSANQGTLHFALRSDEDTDMVLTSGADIDSTLAAYRDIPEIPVKKKATAPRTVAKPDPPSVELITGGEKTTVSF